MSPPHSHPHSSESLLLSTVSESDKRQQSAAAASPSSSVLPPSPTTNNDAVDVASIPAMVYTYTINHDDGSSNFPYVSEYCETIFGFTAHELMTRPELLMNAVHKDDSQKFTRSVVESMQNMTVWDFQFRMLDRQGNVKFVHGKSRPAIIEQKKNGGGTATTQTLTKWSGCLFDITEQERHNALARNEMRELMNESMAPIFGMDRNGIVDEWNATMSRLTGYAELEAVGRPLVSFMPEEQRGNIAMLLGNILRSEEESSSPSSSSSAAVVAGEAAEQECILLTKEQKKPLYLYVKCITRHDSNGEITGVAFSGQDITKVKEEEKKKEAALKLVDAEKGLTEWLSHEVRNPLSIATEAAEALTDDPYYTNNEESAGHVDLISQSLSYIVDLLTDMLDLNKCVEGKVVLHPKVCHVRDEVLIPTRDMTNVRNKSVQVSVVEGGEDIVAVVDNLRLRQVVTNLVSNSLKFTSKGFVRIKLKRSIGDTMVLTVSDSGCGIRPEHYDSLFSKWEQLGSRTNGTGIGLCLCQALVRVMGGHISLNRDYNSGIVGHPGAEFVIELPMNSGLTSDFRERSSSPVNTFDAVSRAVVAARTGKSGRCVEAATVPRRAKEASKATKQDSVITNHCCVRGKYHILIVDDDRVGRKFIRRRFQRLFPDAVIEEAVSGEEAVAKAEEREIAYDIITMDHFMAIGDMNGAETIQMLRDNKVDAFVIGLSGNAKQGEHLLAGADDFIQKPIPSDETILDMLLSHLAPPNGWSVLTVDDVEMNNHFMSRKLRNISSPHFTDMAVAEKRWSITSALTGEEAVQLLRTQYFDLVILDNQLGGGISGLDVGRFVREHAVNKDAIVVLNSGSVFCQMEGLGDDCPFNLFWPKPLPNLDKMRLNLCCELLSRQRSGLSRQESELD